MFATLYTLYVHVKVCYVFFSDFINVPAWTEFPWNQLDQVIWNLFPAFIIYASCYTVALMSE